MKKEYHEPEVEIILLSRQDVIATSPVGEGEQPEQPGF